MKTALLLILGLALIALGGLAGYIAWLTWGVVSHGMAAPDKMLAAVAVLLLGAGAAIIWRWA